MDELTSDVLLAHHLELICAQEISGLDKEDTRIYLDSILLGLQQQFSTYSGLVVLMSRLRTIQLQSYTRTAFELQTQLLQAVQIAWKAINPIPYCAPATTALPIRRMVSHLYLLRQRAELQQLYEENAFNLEPGQRENDKVIQVAEWAIQIITEWPASQWPLPDEPNSWPEQADVIAILQMSLDKAKNYRGNFSLDDFDEWTRPRLELTAGLYCFRPEE